MNQYTTIQSLIGQPVAVHCPTEAEANEFLKLCYAEGVKWSGGFADTTSNMWNTNKAATYYTLHSNKIMFGDLKLCSHITIPFSEFTNKPQPYTPEELEFMDRCVIATVPEMLRQMSGMETSSCRANDGTLTDTGYKILAKYVYGLSVAMLKAKQLLTNK